MDALFHSNRQSCPHLRTSYSSRKVFQLPNSHVLLLPPHNTHLDLPFLGTTPLLSGFLNGCSIPEKFESIIRYVQVKTLFEARHEPIKWCVNAPESSSSSSEYVVFDTPRFLSYSFQWGFDLVGSIIFPPLFCIVCVANLHVSNALSSRHLFFFYYYFYVNFPINISPFSEWHQWITYCSC